jgi:hypothetical protein
MIQTPYLHWPVTCRTRRVGELIVILCALSLCDLLFTLWAHRWTPFEEGNPIARILLNNELILPLVMMKVGLTGLAAWIFWHLRRHGRAEAALWGVVALYVLLAVRWSDYTSSIMLLGVPHF